MSLAELLDTDVAGLGGRLKKGVIWWLDELGDLAKPLTGGGAAKVPPLLADRQADGRFLILRAGRPEAVYSSEDRTERVAIALPAEAVLIHHLWRPSLAEWDLQRLIALDLDRLTPFPADDVYADVRVLGDVDANGHRRVRLAVTPRAQVDALLIQATAAGLEPTTAVSLQEEEVIDFRPAMRAAGVLGPQPRRYLIWATIALLLALNIAVAIWRDSQATSALETAVESQGPLVSQIRALRQQTASLRAQAAHQAEARGAGEPLRVLDGLSRALPSTAWVQRLNWDGSVVRVTGQQTDGVDVIGALRHDPMFTDVKTAEGSGATSATSFDLQATVTPASAGRR